MFHASRACKKSPLLSISSSGGLEKQSQRGRFNVTAAAPDNQIQMFRKPKPNILDGALTNPSM